MRYPNILNAYDLVGKGHGPDTNVKGWGWVPARGIGWMTLSSRLRATWLVFTGRADALVWPGQGTERHFHD